MFVVNLLEIFQNLYSLLQQKIQTNPLTRTWQNMMDSIDYTESTFWDTAKKIFNLTSDSRNTYWECVSGFFK